MEHNSPPQSKKSQQSPRKRSFIPSLPRSASLLNVLKPSRKQPHRKRRSVSEISSTSAQGTFSLIHPPETMPTRERHQSIDIPQHHLMKPLHPPIPKSQTLGSLETNLLYITPKTSPTHSKRSSASPSKVFSTPLNIHGDRPVLRQARTSQYGGQVVDRVPNRPIAHSLNYFTRKPVDKTSTNNIPVSQGSAGTWPSQPGGVYRNMSLKHPAPAPIRSSLSRRKTLSPTQARKSDFTRGSMSHEVSNLSGEVPAVPPLPSASRLSRLITPKSVPAPPRARSRYSTPTGGQRSRVPTPVGPARETSSSTFYMSSSLSRSGTTESRLPTRLPRPNITPSQNRRPSILKKQPQTPPVQKASRSPLVHSRSSPDGSPTPRAARHGYPPQKTSIPPMPNLSVSHAQSSNLLTSFSMPSIPSTQYTTNKISTTPPTPRAASGPCHGLSMVTNVDTFEPMEAAWWLGRYVSISDRLRTQEISTKAAAASFGDPGEANHPANTGMLDETNRKLEVFGILRRSCKTVEAHNSLDDFSAKFIQKENADEDRAAGRTKPATKKAERRKTSNTTVTSNAAASVAVSKEPEVKGKINVFERLGMKKRSKSKIV